MKKYIIRWNSGYGDNYDVVEAVSPAEAEDYAYEAWKQEVEDNADYEVFEYTDELAEDLL